MPRVPGGGRRAAGGGRRAAGHARPAHGFAPPLDLSPVCPRPVAPPNPMISASKLIPQGRGLASALLRRAATVELDWDTRCKSRFEATDSQGRHLGVFLPRGSVTRGGDVLVCEDGSLVRVTAAPQDVLVVRHCSEHGTPFDLMRAAYHLGNRHVQLQLAPDHLKLEPDHVLADLLRAMHLIVSEERAPFDPEGGAYAMQAEVHGHGHHGHDHHGHDHHGHDHHGHDHHGHGHHGHDHSHGLHKHDHHGHGHEHEGHEQGHDPAPAAPHVHGPGCSHDAAHPEAPAPVSPASDEHGHRH